tara:strand:+ start:9208 stop:10893 length:1686 start_codon:yes stop_codon:yes gene_type:complete
MTGGLLNLIAYGNQNIILNGNPTKSFFKSSYSKYTNFGLQKYRIDQTGQTNISITKDTQISFKIKRYGDLLMDTYLVINLPKIWSPIYQHTNADTGTIEYRPYEFQWIKNIGTQLIKKVEFTIGGHIIQKFSGNYLQNMVQRDFDNSKKELFNNMIGNVKELTDPANYENRSNNYPNAYKRNDLSFNLIEPSIDNYQLQIPLNTWFSLLSNMSIPLICLQYAELEINFELNKLENLFTIKDVIYNEPYSTYDEIPRIRINSSESNAYNFNRFTQEPPTRDISLTTLYPENNINTDIHLITTQCFLDNEERTHFSENIQEYLVKVIYEYNFIKVNKTSKVNLDSNGLVSNWMWYFQRDDVYKRNEWSNYTNWPYENIIPNNLIKLKDSNDYLIFYNKNNIYDISKNIYITGNQAETNEQNNKKEILKNFSIIVDGKYREQEFNSNIYSKLEKYTKTKSNSKEGLYHYNFCLTTDPFKYQPTGAFNTNKFKNVQFEFNIHNNPPIDSSASNFSTICDPETGVVIATTMEPTSIYTYNYNLTVFEERYNILRFEGGMAGLVYSI